jgi:adenine deaminase
MEKRTLDRLLRCAKGEAPADTIIRNGKIVNVFTNSVDEGAAISIKDGFIVDVGEEARLPRVSPETEIIDAGGRYLCPGFIDAHTHLDNIYTFYELVPCSLKGGTTCCVSESGMVGTSCGMAALESFYDSTKGYPLRCYFLAPPLTPPFPAMETAVGLSMAEFGKILRRDDVLGIGEAYWTRVVEGDDRVLEQASLALSLGKTLEGHGAGAKGSKLVQYLVTGIMSDHESIAAEEAVDRLKHGVYVMIRQGFVRKELPALSALKDMDLDARRLILVSDTFDATMLAGQGYLDTVVRAAVEYGFSPIAAIKMATINPADYYRLRHLGAIAPMRCADILFLDDLAEVSVRHVMFNGEMAVIDREFKGQAPAYRYPEAVKHTVKTEKVAADDFRVAANPGKKRVRVIYLVNATITREAEALLESDGGYLQKDLEKDIVPAAVISRGSGKRMGKGFITGTGVNHGAFATTFVWDTCNILTAGSDEADMAKAVNRLIDLQGGIVVSREGRIIYELAMPIYGIISDSSMKEIARKTMELDGAMAAIGVKMENPFLALQTIPFTGLPFLRITDKGLADIKNKRLVPLFL